ncbi:MAG: DUF1636 domain-containing protein [Rhodobacteraceae bacterium]|nr:DUF1636 domain-containing protein [Paracoccaceae bacterium]
MTTWITICDTCKSEGWEAGAQELTDGERLAGMIEALVAEDDTLRCRRISCLMGCKNACNVAIQAEGKLNYTLGQFEAEQDAAEAIVGYANLHAQSESGQVPYRTWPQGVKGHFVTRHPPLPKDEPVK